MKESVERVKARAKLEAAEAVFDRWWTKLLTAASRAIKAREAAKRYRRALQDLDARERAVREDVRAARRIGAAPPEGTVTP